MGGGLERINPDDYRKKRAGAQDVRFSSRAIVSAASFSAFISFCKGLGSYSLGLRAADGIERTKRTPELQPM